MQGYILADQDTNRLLYAQACCRGRRGDILSALTGRSRRLLALDEALKDVTLRTTGQETQAAAVRRTVPIDDIRGSESRVADFDRDFNPLNERSRERWLGIAAARQRGRALPPVALTQVGDRYFVRDGHHRISVARAMGQRTIEATVEVWRVDEPVHGGQQQPAAIRWRGCSLQNDEATRRTDPTEPAAASVPPSILGWLARILVRSYGGTSRAVTPVEAGQGAG